MTSPTRLDPTAPASFPILVYFPHGEEKPIPRLVYLVKRLNDLNWQVTESARDAADGLGALVPSRDLLPYNADLWRACELYAFQRKAMLEDLAKRYRALQDPVRQIRMAV